MDISESLLDVGKADWSNVLRKRQETIDSIEKVPYLETPITYEEFFLNFLLPNKPCVMGPWVTEGWRSRKEWCTAQGSVHLDHMETHFGQASVPVANCNKELYSSQPKEDMTLSSYIQYMKAKHAGNSDDSCLYLKDWHFTREFPHYKAYTTPIYFKSDWLNEHWQKKSDICDDYRFVYFGPKGSWTPFHADVMRSYSWSANICGTKLWWLFPPGDENFFKDNLGQLAYDLRSEKLKDPKQFPSMPEKGRKLVVTQHSGEIIFVPSCWHHQVFNLEDTISINHNWINGCAVDQSWAHLRESLSDVQREISDCVTMEGWDDQCQLILKANNGIDFKEFYHFLHDIANQRTATEKSDTVIHGVQNDGSERQNCQQKDSGLYLTIPAIGSNMALFDLYQIATLLEEMLQCKEFRQLEWGTIESPYQLLERIKRNL